MRRSASRSVFLASVALGLALAGILPAPAQTTTATPEEKAAAIVRPAIVYIEMEWTAWVKVPRNSDLFYVGYVNEGQPFVWGTRCSGFVVNPGGYVVTAGHCVDPGEEGARGDALAFAVQWLIDTGWAFKRDFGYWQNEGHMMWKVEGTEANSPPDLQVWVQRGVAAGGLRTGEAFPARVVDLLPLSEGDVAVLKIEESDLPSVLVAPSASIDIGMPVLSVGYPGSTDLVTDATYEPTFKDGRINAEKTREGGLLPVYEISAAMSGGMSGGPTVDLTGQVVGVNSFGIFGETEAFNFITPASVVGEILARNGVTNVLGPIDEAYRAGLDAFYAGDYQTAVTKFDEVLGLSPTHQQAQELKVEANKVLQASPPPPPTPAGGATPAPAEEGGFPVVAVVGIAAAAVVVLGGLLVFSRRGRKPTVPTAPAAAPMAPPAVGTPVAPSPSQEPAGVGFRPPAQGPAGTAVQPPPQAAAPGAPPPKAEPQASDAAHFCPSCGHALEGGAKFCPSCGHKVDA